MQMGTSEISKGQHEPTRQGSEPAGPSYNHFHLHPFCLLEWFYGRHYVKFEPLASRMLPEWDTRGASFDGDERGKRVMFQEKWPKRR